MVQYRKDKRSLKEFKADIKSAKQIEFDILVRWLDYIHKTKGIVLSYAANAPGDDGEYLEDSEVTTDADYTVESYGLIEVKFSKPKMKKHFHLKVDQVASYIKQKATLLLIDGYETECPEWTLIYPDKLELITKHPSCKIVPWVGFGMKEAYRIPLDMFYWRELNAV